jgi:hypothetical protein
MLRAATFAAAMGQRRRRRRQRDEPETSASCRSPQPGSCRVAGESSTVSSSKIAVENMNLLEKRFLLVQTAFRRARAASAGTKSRPER